MEIIQLIFWKYSKFHIFEGVQKTFFDTYSITLH